MRALTIILSLIFNLSAYAQSWPNICAYEGLLQIEEVGDVTKMWIESAYFNCYGPPSEKWQEFRLYCHDGQQNELFKIPFGDTLEMLIGNDLVVVAASSKYRRGSFPYGTSCPNVCISGSADANCFKEYTEPNYIFEQGCILPSLTGVVVSWPQLDIHNVTVYDLVAEEPYCITAGTCFFIAFINLDVTEVICF